MHTEEDYLSVWERIKRYIVWFFWANLSLRTKLRGLLLFFLALFFLFQWTKQRSEMFQGVTGVSQGEIDLQKDVLADIIPPPMNLEAQYLIALELTDGRRGLNVAGDLKRVSDLRDIAEVRFRLYEDLYSAQVNAGDKEHREPLELIQEMHKNSNQFYEIWSGEVARKLDLEQMDEARKLVALELRPLYYAQRSLVDQLQPWVEKNQIEDVAHLKKQQKEGRETDHLYNAAFSVLMLLFGIAIEIIGHFFSSGMVKVCEELERISQGDLTQRSTKAG
ncbi:MAG: hypothetical protein WC045_01190 [Patescibacteria group bacterium]